MIHVDCLSLAGADEKLFHRLCALASPARRRRADRLLRRQDALCTLAAEALVRRALFLHCAGVPFAMETTPLGKPFVPGQETFHFSLSHSGEWVILAHGSAEVGVDVEKIDPARPSGALARRFFTPEECTALSAASDTAAAFTDLWCRRESIAKYLGTGLAAAPKDLSALSPPPGTALTACDLPGGYRMALCGEEIAYTLSFLTPGELFSF